MYQIEVVSKDGNDWTVTLYKDGEQLQEAVGRGLYGCLEAVTETIGEREYDAAVGL
jgi:hypothetical protein